MCSVFMKIRLTSFYFILFLIIYFYLYGHLTIYGSSNQDDPKVFKQILQREATPFIEQVDLQKSNANLYRPNSCLIFIQNRQESLSNNLKELKLLLESLRFAIKIVQLDQFSIRSLFKFSKKYSFIVFESWDLFNSQSHADQTEFTNHCEQYQIGLLFFNIGNQRANSSRRINELEECHLNTLILQKHEIKLNLTKLQKKPVSFKSKVDFFFNDVSKLNSYNCLLKCKSNRDLIVSLQNKPNMRHIVFNIDLSIGFPMVTTLFIDLLAHLTYGRFWISNKRYVQIDIDDIFVGPTRRRMKPDDVFELINFQENYLNEKIFTFSDRKFKFNLGFSGHFYQSGNSQENEADKLLLQQRDFFNWFDHGWSHYQPHLMNSSLLKQHMLSNYEFAINNSLQVNSMYAVTPHHSGVYPIYDTFLNLWKEIWNIKATSTETYPHLKPFHMRRGFVHNEIMVLPRQACGIYTHTIYLKDYPKGEEKLFSMINGGELFKALLTNQVLIYMTHMTNYGSDRIALFLFRKLFDYLNEWSNIELYSLEPFEIAKKYFEFYPNETDPLWTNACDDKSHLKIWSMNSTDYCQRIPQFLIIGPQKTGTTALHKYLSIHPQLKTNKMTSEFEETQFFSKNYFLGIDWYLSLFEKENNSSNMFFEKSATYFADPLAPIRIRSFKKDMKLVFITIDPVDRAYSWYQHMKHHDDEIATNFSFHDVITLNHTNVEALSRMKRLRKRCLDPGIYHKHLSRWLSYFKSDQILIVDGDLLKSDPSKSLSNLQKFLQLSEIVDYRNYLAFDKRKGFFCLINKKRQKTCLGSSKGRKYDKMDSRTRDFLENYYLNYNKQFYNLLIKNAFDIPIWLKSLNFLKNSYLI